MPNTDPSTSIRLHSFAGPVIGALTLVCASAGWQTGLLDHVAMPAAVVICFLFMIMPAVSRTRRIATAYAGALFAALHGLAIYVGMTGGGLLHPAGYFSTVLPILSAVFVGRAAGLVNAGLAVGYIGIGLYGYFNFPTPVEAHMAFGVAVVTALAMLVTMLLGLGVSLLFIAQSEAFADRQRRTNQALEAARTEVSEALANMSNGLVMVSADATIRLYNRRVLELFGLAPDGIGIGMALDRYVANVGAVVGWDAARIVQIVENHREWMEKPTTTRIEHHFENGKILSISCRPLAGGGAILTYDDVTEAREGQKRIAHMAFHDALTGLPNRRSFSDHVARMSERAGFAMLMLDLDRFKAVNDTLGHAVGDALLVEVARRLRDLCRPTDLVFRLGGDELAVLAHVSLRVGEVLAAEIVAAIARPFEIGEHTISIGASIGLAMGARSASPVLVQRMADLALYKAKEAGRGRVETYREGMIEEAEERHRLESELAGAVEAGQFELHYQPLYALPGRTLVGFEALLRWRHPERGLVGPSEFIPIAEQSGAILEIGAWVIDAACRQAAQWPADTYVSINISPVQLRSPDILRQLTAALDRHGLTARRIEIEITETAMVENSEEIAATLTGLRALGVRIAMDDFGTGYSSLAHLREFPLDRIKIDRSFISAAHTDSGSAAVVRAVTAMARDLAIATTGEGVESEEQLARLIALGCGTAQGYLLGRPLDADAASALFGTGARRRADPRG